MSLRKSWARRIIFEDDVYYFLSNRKKGEDGQDFLVRDKNTLKE
jgi:hypothetical protein